MKPVRTVLFVVTLAAALHAESPVHMTSRQAALRARKAHSAADFNDLALFYCQQSELFSKASKQQHDELEFDIHHRTAKSYPQASDRARMLSEYYNDRSERSNELAMSYARKAAALEAHAPSASNAPAAISQAAK